MGRKGLDGRTHDERRRSGGSSTHRTIDVDECSDLHLSLRVFRVRRKVRPANGELVSVGRCFMTRRRLRGSMRGSLKWRDIETCILCCVTYNIHGSCEHRKRYLHYTPPHSQGATLAAAPDGSASISSLTAPPSADASDEAEGPTISSTTAAPAPALPACVLPAPPVVGRQ